MGKEFLVVAALSKEFLHIATLTHLGFEGAACSGSLSTVGVLAPRSGPLVGDRPHVAAAGVGQSK